MVDNMKNGDSAETAPDAAEQRLLEEECARQAGRARLGLILATLGAVLLGGGLVEATVLQCSTLNITLVLAMMGVGMVLLIGGGALTGLALFATRRLGNSQTAQLARRKVTRAYVVIVLLIAGVLALAYSITITIESGQQAAGLNGTTGQAMEQLQ